MQKDLSEKCNKNKNSYVYVKVFGGVLFGVLVTKFIIFETEKSDVNSTIEFCKNQLKQIELEKNEQIRECKTKVHYDGWIEYADKRMCRHSYNIAQLEELRSIYNLYIDKLKKRKKELGTLSGFFSLRKNFGYIVETQSQNNSGK